MTPEEFAEHAVGAALTDLQAATDMLNHPGPAMVPLTMVPVEVFGGECTCHEAAEAEGRGDGCRGWGYGLMDAVEAWSDCNRAVGRIYRVEDLTEPGEDPAKYRKAGEVITVWVPRDQVAWFERRWGEEAGGRDSVAYIRGEVAGGPDGEPT